jgi:uncharacterized protein DUF6504
MRRYDDPVDVRKGMVPGTGGARLEGPEQFVWRGRLWRVCDVVGHWVETGAWWRSAEAAAVGGAEEIPAGGVEEPPVVGGPRQTAVAAPDLLAEREVWRVEAARGRTATGAGRGVFDLVFDWADGTWRLARCAD